MFSVQVETYLPPPTPQKKKKFFPLKEPAAKDKTNEYTLYSDVLLTIKMLPLPLFFNGLQLKNDYFYEIFLIEM